MKDREFDDDEIDYLRSLPAVNSVGRNRIRYTDQFREYCMQRYRAGDSPTGIFRDVGLDPALIGYKRIERCIARWKMMDPADADAEPISADKFPRTGNPLIPPAPIRAATIRENFGGSAAKDLRDMLIAQQIRYIHELTALGEGALPYQVAEWVFIISGGMTLCYMFKLYLCLFWQKNPTRQAEYDGMRKYLSVPSGIALGLCATFIPVLGLRALAQFGHAP